MMEEDFRDLIASASAVAALVDARVYPLDIPQGAADPNITYFEVSGAPDYTYAGPVAMQQSLMQVNIRALTYASARAVRDAVTAALSGFKGTHGETSFHGIFLRQRRQFSDRTGTKTYRTIQMDFDVWHRTL